MYVIYTMGVVMSIEQEKLESENTENSLEQYGVWVKKSAGANEDSSMNDVSTDEDSEFASFDETDFDSGDLDIFSEDIVLSDDNSDFDFETEDDVQEKIDEDDADDTTLTTDELLNITSGMSLEEEAETEDTNEDLDIDFDSFMDIDDIAVESESPSEETSDFDLMDDGLNQSVASNVDINDDEIAVFDDESDDISISFDDFMNEESTGDESKEESPLDMDITFDESTDDDFSVISEETFEMDLEENSPIDLGEEISLDDIPDSEDSTFSTDSFDEKNTIDQDYNLNVDAEETAASKTADSNDMLSKIVNELSNLRQEMAQFKSELSKIKTDSPSNNVKADGTPEGGFFSDYEGDDTIALSGDELNNILTSADFTVDGDSDSEESSEAVAEISEPQDSIQETVIEEEVSLTDDMEDSLSDDEFDVDSLDDNYFSSSENTLVIDDKDLVEPSLDDINFDIDMEDSLPDEIEVPVIEDLVVDSSPVSFFDDEEEQIVLSDDTMQHLQEDPSDAGIVLDEDMIADEDDDFEVDEDLSEEIKDSDIVEGYEPDINDPVSTVFSSDQWQSDIGEDDDMLSGGSSSLNAGMQDEIKSVLSYMDRLLESLPEEKISEFAQSEYFDRYKKLFSDLGIS